MKLSAVCLHVYEDKFYFSSFFFCFHSFVDFLFLDTNLYFEKRISNVQKPKQDSGFTFVGYFSLMHLSLLSVLFQVNKLKLDLACMKQELQSKEQGFQTLRE